MPTLGQVALRVGAWGYVGIAALVGLSVDHGDPHDGRPLVRGEEVKCEDAVVDRVTGDRTTICNNGHFYRRGPAGRADPIDFDAPDGDVDRRTLRAFFGDDFVLPRRD